MRKGARVLAGGHPGVITKMQENRINDVDYVYYIDVKRDDKKCAGVYHPDDVQLDRRAPFPETLASQPTPPAINSGSYQFTNPVRNHEGGQP